MAPKTPTEGTRSSTRRTSTSAPKSPATPTTASPASKSPKSSSKRVRVVEPEVVVEVAAPVASVSKAKKGKRVSIGGAEDEETKDLKNKSLGEIKEIVSAEVPAPLKGALKKPATKEKKSKKEVVSIIEPEVEEVEEVEEEGEGEGEIDFLKGFESDAGADSSDEEMDEGENKVEFDIEALPKLSKEEAGVQKKLEEKAERRRNAKTGTIYLGRIPHGFHEVEMKSYFSQFGEITRLRLSRNKNSGASKHYAFIEFAYASVAQIVQETMDNYLLSGHILVCKIVPDNEIHPSLWVGANRAFRPVPKGRRDRVRREAPKTTEQLEKTKKRLISREQKKRASLAALGIDYDFSGYAAKEVAVIAAPEPVKAVKAVKAKKEKVVKEKKSKSEEPAKKKARKSM